MQQFYTIMTNLGKKKIIDSLASNTKINLTKIILGDSNGKYYEPNPEQTELKNKVWEGNIGKVTTPNEPNWITLETIVPADVGGFYIREIGIIAEDGTLMAIGKYPETYKPTPSDNSFKELYINAIIEVSNTEVINVTLDPNVILVTKKYLDVRLSEIELTPGPQGPAGKDGTSVNILGSKDSVDLLPSEGNNPGDGWLVNGDLYVWDVTNQTWVNVGNIKGPQGATGPQGEVGPQGATGPTGPRGEKGTNGTFDSSTQFPSLNTNNKTVLGAINELKGQIGNITIKVVQ